MAITNYNIAPYYDDFDKTKNYLRTLFRPGVAVQARELTQLQSALQAQIDRFGSHVFVDGSPVIGAQPTLDTKFAYVKIESSFTLSSGLGGGSVIPDNYYDEAIGKTLTGLTSGVTAIVLDATAAASGDPLTLFIKYNSSGTDNETQVFDPEEEISFTNASAVVRYLKVMEIASGDIYPTGYGSRLSLTEGVYFVNGNFVYTPASALILEKYSDEPSARIVYLVSENVVTSGDDATLTDNALGAPNYAAPGAHRYQIELTLDKQPIAFANRDEDDIIQILVVESGVIRQRARTVYSELGDTLAQRTFEESGNYTVRPFQINIREHLNDEAGNGGLYTAAQSGDVTKLAIGLEPSVAYVNGYRIEIEDTKYVEVNKARDEAYINASSTLASLGNYILIDNVVSSPDVNNFATLNLKDSASSPTTVGTARARSIEYVSGTIGSSAAIYKLYLFDISLNSSKTFADVASVSHSYGASVEFTADLTESVLYDVSNNSAVFKLPVDAIQTLSDQSDTRDVIYHVRKKYDGEEVTGGSITISASANEIFQSTTVSDWFIADVSDGAVQTGFSIALGGGGSSIIFSGLAAGTYDITGPSRRTAQEKTKTLQIGATLAITSPNTTVGDYDLLAKADIWRVTAVYMSADFSTAATISDTNIVDRYILDNGQRDNFYDIGRIQLKPGATPPTGSLLIHFDYFSHGAGDFFSVDSYSANIGSGTDFQYDDIPSFQSIRGLIQLRDAIDFRPRKDNAGSNFTSTGASLVSMVDPASIFTADIQYYLPRIDKIYVDKNGVFGAATGISAVNPRPPEDPKDAMVLYQVRLGAYTFGPSDVVPSMIDNKRYTMRDIGKIEKRVTKLEYYTSLSLLEKETADTQLFDNSNNVRFKNGFVVDGFYGHNVGAITHPDYRISMDKTEGKLRPLFVEDNVKLAYTSGSSSGVQKTGPLLTLSYSEVSAGIEQPYASYAEFVNPYNVFVWSGELKLSPESDEWKETERRPDVVVDQSGIYDSLKFIEDETNLFGTVWNEWQTNWTGVSNEEVTFQNNDWFGWRDAPTTVITTTTQVEQSRTGIRTSFVPDTVTTNLGDRVVEVNFVPFIRSRKIYFKATKLKPNTKVYAFFDGVGVSNFVKEEASFTQYADRTDVVNYKDVTSHPDTAGALITDASGEVIGSFIVPNTSNIKFKTGPRVFRLTDSSTNATGADTYAEAVYDARGLLETKENLTISTRVPRIDRTQVTENRVIFETTQQVEESTEWIDPVAQTFMVDTAGGMFATAIDLYFSQKDANIPVTVSIRICENGIPTQRIVPFSNITKSAGSVNISATAATATKFTFDAPVHLIEGVEYAFVVTSNSDAYKLWVSELGGYDVTNTTYRITKQPYNGVFFKSQNASTWTPDQTKDIKFKFYRASFGSSGTAIFNEVNLPTRLLVNSALETTNGSQVVKVYHKNHGHFAGTSKVTLSGVAANSGSNMNGIPIAELNTTHDVVDVEPDSYTIETATTAATSSGRAGGSAIYATQNRLMNVFQPIIQQVVFPNTQTLWSTKATTARSLAGSETPHTVTTNYFNVKANDNTYLTFPHAIVSSPNYALLSSGSKSFILRGLMSTVAENLSPVIDLDRVSVITVGNRIDNPAAIPSGGSAPSGFNGIEDYIAETAANAGSALSKYITRKIELNDPANALKIYLLANKPAAAGIDVYYKILPNGSDEAFDSIEWTEISPDSSIPSTDNPNEYSEIEYTYDPVSPVEFTAFAVKIVFTSTNSSAVPTCRDFRALAIT